MRTEMSLERSMRGSDDETISSGIVSMRDSDPADAFRDAGDRPSVANFDFKEGVLEDLASMVPDDFREGREALDKLRAAIEGLERTKEGLEPTKEGLIADGEASDATSRMVAIERQTTRVERRFDSLSEAARGIVSSAIVSSAMVSSGVLETDQDGAGQKQQPADQDRVEQEKATPR